MTYKQGAFAITAQEIIKNLKRRNMEGFYCESSQELLDTILPMLEEGSSVAFGGSESLKESGLLNALQTGNYEMIDRNTAETDAERREIWGRTAVSDYYLMSTNAITLDGELVNIDGNGNRVSALIYGPKQVMIIVGMNKIVSDIEKGIARIRDTACPPNAYRLNKSTPCGITGRCGNCLSSECMCNQIVITRRSGHTDRIKVFLVGESLGF